MAEEHLFFPEWADRPASSEALPEADHNSYLAGGYAEEFGHRCRASMPRMASPAAEEDGAWRVHKGCLHPGYPECPRPLDRDFRGAVRGATATLARVEARDKPPRASAAYRVLIVGRDSANRFGHAVLLAGIARLWKALSIRRRGLPLT